MTGAEDDGTEEATAVDDDTRLAVRGLGRTRRGARTRGDAAPTEAAEETVEAEPIRDPGFGPGREAGTAHRSRGASPETYPPRAAPEAGPPPHVSEPGPAPARPSPQDAGARVADPAERARRQRSHARRARLRVVAAVAAVTGVAAAATALLLI